MSPPPPISFQVPELVSWSWPGGQRAADVGAGPGGRADERAAAGSRAATPRCPRVAVEVIVEL